jgi:SAM-dependent methyltransferase
MSTLQGTALNKINRRFRYNLCYFGRPPWDTGISPPELIEYLQNTTPGKALDVGCGTGTNLLTMASYGWDVVGFDLSWISVLKARIKLLKAGAKGRVLYGDASAALQPGTDFDLILDIGCYHGLSPQERGIYRRNLARWLKPGGNYLLYAHLKTASTALYGLSGADFEGFSEFLNCQWRVDSPERRPDGGGGNPASWTLFERRQNNSRG